MYDLYYYCNRHPLFSPPIALSPAYRASNSNDQGNKGLHVSQQLSRNGARKDENYIGSGWLAGSHIEVLRWIDGTSAVLAGRANYS